jgi:hypothetical protein
MQQQVVGTLRSAHPTILHGPHPEEPRILRGVSKDGRRIGAGLMVRDALDALLTMRIAQLRLNA